MIQYKNKMEAKPVLIRNPDALANALLAEYLGVSIVPSESGTEDNAVLESIIQKESDNSKNDHSNLYGQYLTSDVGVNTCLPDSLALNQEASELQAEVPNRESRFGKFILGLSKAAFVTKNVIETSAVALEISPANETARYAIFGWVHTTTGGNIVASATAFGLSTFIIEAAAALMAADLLETRTSKKVIAKINELSERFIKSDNTSKDISLIARAATAMVFGSAVLLAAKHRKNPERTKRYNQISGLKTAATMGLYFTGEELFVGQSVNSYGWVKTIIGGVAVLAVTQGIVKKIADRREQKK